MKPDEPIYRVVQVPLLMQKSLSLLHSDDYVKDNVELSTFTPESDILLKLNQKFLMFDKHGNQLKVAMDSALVHDKSLLTDFKLTQVQIITRPEEQQLDLLLPKGEENNPKDETFLGLLFEKADSHEAMVLAVRKSQQGDNSGYSIQILTKRHSLFSKELSDSNFIIRLK